MSDVVTASPPADLLPVQRRATLTYRLARIVLLPVLHAIFVFQVSGRTNRPRRGAYVLISNHLNWLDSFAILASLPPQPRVHFLGNADGLQQHRFQWAFIRSIGGYIPVDSHHHSGAPLYHHVNRCLQVGGVVALYPEGHYGAAEGGLEPFKKGFAHFAIENHVPVLPVCLSGTKDLWLRRRIRVVIGEPLSPDGHSPESLVELAHQRMTEQMPSPRPSRGPRLLRRRLTNLL
jgi:1-acyl-sn-glycerol-3-phosphate acyltransferase